jgi:hypothetical protein
MIALIKDHEDELKAKGALRADVKTNWEAMTLEDITPDELEFLLQTFAVDGKLDEEEFVFADRTDTTFHTPILTTAHAKCP